MRFAPSAFAAAALLATAIPAAAQSGAFYYSGYASVEYFTPVSGAAVTIGTTDLTFGVAPGGAGLEGVGFELGLIGYIDDSGNRDAALFASATFDIGGGRLHVGAPRTAAYGYSNTPPFIGSFGLNNEIGILTGAVPSSLALLSNAGPLLGVMYERESGPLRFSVSLGQLRSGAVEHTILAGGVAREFGNSRVFGTAEVRRSSASGTRSVVTLGASTRLAGMTSSLSDIEVGGTLVQGFGSASSLSALTLYGTAALTDRLDIGTMVFRASGSSFIYGVNASYEVWNGFTTNLGVGSSSSASGAFWTFGLSRTF